MTPAVHLYEIEKNSTVFIYEIKIGLFPKHNYPFICFIKYSRIMNRNAIVEQLFLSISSLDPVRKRYAIFEIENKLYFKA